MTPRAREPGGRPTDAGDVVELAAVMVGVFALLALVLYFGMRWLAAEAAGAAAQRALEVAQSDGGTVTDAEAVAVRLAESSRAVAEVTVTVTTSGSGNGDGRVGAGSGVGVGSGSVSGQVDVTVTVTPVVGGSLSRTASGPRLEFVPQAPALR